MLMAFVTIVIAMVGYGIARIYRYWSKSQKTGLLDPPLDIFGGKYYSKFLKYYELGFPFLRKSVIKMGLIDHIGKNYLFLLVKKIQIWII